MQKSKTSGFVVSMVMVVLMTVAFAMTAFAGTWQQDLFGWHYTKDDGTLQEPGWLYDNGAWYVIGENGTMRTGWYSEISDGSVNWYYLAPSGAMQTGWVFDNGSWYFMSNKSTDGQTYGKMLAGPAWIDNYSYYFDPVSGVMAASQIANGGIYGADGKAVGADGSALKQTVFLDSTNVYSTSVAAGSSSSSVSHASSGGSSGGSSGSSSRKSSSGSSSSSSSRNISNDTAWSNYSDSSVSLSANSFTTGNYSRMTSSQIKAMNEAIDDFKDEYIESGMSDFEKEMMIIQYIVENCEYEVGTNFSNSTAYSVLINGKAQCSGYADAFLQMAKACGLNARYVYNTDHAWNLVELDGDWYHVDVTWEDPKGSNNYGFGNLRNMYINLEDDEIRQADYHKTWSPSTIKCSGYKYGPDVVEEYLRTGVVDTSLGMSYDDYVNNSTVASADGFVEGSGGFTDSGCSGNIMYTVRFETADRGYRYARISYCNLNERVKVNYPDGYTYVGLGSGDYSVNKGSGIFQGTTFMVLSGDEDGNFELVITVKKIGDEAEEEEEEDEQAVTALTVRQQNTDIKEETEAEDEAETRAETRVEEESEKEEKSEADEKSGGEKAEAKADEAKDDEAEEESDAGQKAESEEETAREADPEEIEKE